MSFHAPDGGRLEHHPTHGSTARDGNNGAWIIGSPEPGWQLSVIGSDGLGWEHVSACAIRGRQTRTPTWKEMAFLKSLFWDPEDCAIEFHPRASQYVNNHPHVLHLWRPVDETIPEPPSILVGLR